MNHFNLIVDKPSRSCGECVLCCVYPSIEQTQFMGEGMPFTSRKPYGEACVHCTGKGCSVYKVRPSICRNYECLWKFGLIKSSPLVSKAMWSLEFNHETKKHVVICQCENSTSLLNDSEHLYEANKFLLSSINGIPVDFVVIRCANSVNKLSKNGEDNIRVDTCKIANEIVNPFVTTSYLPTPKC